jgi:tetratricopeptide (TPR) repeat protein
MKQIDPAFADFQEAIRVNPRDPYAYGYRGNCYWIKNDFEHARLDYKKALDLAESRGDQKAVDIFQKNIAILDGK